MRLEITDQQMRDHVRKICNQYEISVNLNSDRFQCTLSPKKEIRAPFIRSFTTYVKVLFQIGFILSYSAHKGRMEIEGEAWDKALYIFKQINHEVNKKFINIMRRSLRSCLESNLGKRGEIIPEHEHVFWRLIKTKNGKE